MCIYVYYTFLLCIYIRQSGYNAQLLICLGDGNKTPNTANNSPGMLGS